jgi:Ubiquitin family
MADTEAAPDQAIEHASNNKRPADEINSDPAEIEPKRPATEAADTNNDNLETIEIKVQFGKQMKVVERSLDTTVADLKAEIEEHTSIPATHQKLLFKGQLKDASTLRETGLKNGSKLMVIGTKPEDTKIANNTSTSTKTGAGAVGDWDAIPKSTPWSKEARHEKILSKGVPEDAWPGLEGRQVSLRDDQTYIPGLYNSQGVKVRFTFKQELEQVWIGSPSHTQKVPYSSISKIEAQVIEGQEKYSILRVILGASTSNSYWLYFVPSQYVAAIKMRILGVASLLE